jgi:hypothetical protein
MLEEESLEVGGHYTVRVSMSGQAEVDLALRLGMVVGGAPVALRSAVVEMRARPRWLGSAGSLGKRDGKGTLEGAIEAGAAREAGRVKVQPREAADQRGIDGRVGYELAMMDCRDYVGQVRPYVETVTDSGLVFSFDSDKEVLYDDLGGGEAGSWRRALVPWAQIVSVVCSVAS